MMRAALIILSLWAFAVPVLAKNPPSTLSTQITIAKGKSIHLKLEIAATPEMRARGLMYRKALRPSDGMAFFFPSLTLDEPPTFSAQKFWMKNTLIPLDILFVDASNKILYIANGVPLSEKPVGPDNPIATVIELAGGRAAKEGIAVGDLVQYELQTFPWNLAR